MHLVASDKLTKLFAQHIIWVGGNMVKLVHRDQAVVERLHAEALHREAEGGMGADQHLVITFKERADAVDLAALLAGSRAQVDRKRVGTGKNGYVRVALGGRR